MKILIEESVLRQALNYLETAAFRDSDRDDAITALRSALDSAEKVEPVGEVVKATGSLKDIHIIRWLNYYSPNEGSKLYAAPTPPTPQPNTDELLKHNKISSELVDSEPRRVLPIIPAEESDEEFVRQVEATQCMDDSELREAARAVVEWWKSANLTTSEHGIFDRLRKALEK